MKRQPKRCYENDLAVMFRWMQQTGVLPSYYERDVRLLRSELGTKLYDWYTEWVAQISNELTGGSPSEPPVRPMSRDKFYQELEASGCERQGHRFSYAKESLSRPSRAPRERWSAMYVDRDHKSTGGRDRLIGPERRQGDPPVGRNIFREG